MIVLGGDVWEGEGPRPSAMIPSPRIVHSGDVDVCDGVRVVVGLNWIRPSLVCSNVCKIVPFRVRG